MSVIGAFAAALAAGLALLATRAPSGIERRLRTVDGESAHPRAPLRALGRVVVARSTSDAPERLVATKLAFGLGGALAGAVLAMTTSWGVVSPAVLAYGGFVAPSLIADRLAARRRRDAERAAVGLVEWLHALVASGRPIEPALLTVASHTTGSQALDGCLARVRRDYTLGVPMSSALARNGQEDGIAALTELAARVERARDLGRGVLGLLQDLRDELRAVERARGLEAASHVEGKLTLVLTLCYLPALALLVIIPLFMTLLSGLFGT